MSTVPTVYPLWSVGHRGPPTWRSSGIIIVVSHSTYIPCGSHASLLWIRRIIDLRMIGVVSSNACRCNKSDSCRSNPRIYRLTYNTRSSALTFGICCNRAYTHTHIIYYKGKHRSRFPLAEDDTYQSMYMHRQQHYTCGDVDKFRKTGRDLT